MNIGFDAKRAFHNKTGLGNYSRDSINLLSKFYPKNNFLLYNPKKGNINFDITNSNTKVIYPRGIWHKLTSSYWRQRPIVKQLIKDNVDVFVGLSNELPHGINKSKVKSVVVIHDLIFIRFPELYSKIDQKIHVQKVTHACNIADKIIAISEQTKEDIISFLKINPNKISVVYQGCRDAFQTEYNMKSQSIVRRKYKLPKKYILSVGTIEKRKNLMNTVEAISDFDYMHLVVIGRETKYASIVKKFIQENNMNHRVHFLKDISTNELASIYQLADIFVYNSIFEGFGIPIIEALFSKTPVITSTGSCFWEAGGKYSWYVNPNDSSELKLSILELWNSPETKKEMAERGFEFVQKFRHKNIAHNLFNAITS